MGESTRRKKLGLPPRKIKTPAIKEGKSSSLLLGGERILFHDDLLFGMTLLFMGLGKRKK